MLQQTVVNKAPAEVKNYLVNWAPWLEPPANSLLSPDTISGSTWTILPVNTIMGAAQTAMAPGSTNLSVQSDSFTDTTTTVYLQGGILNRQYQVTNTITTAGGLTAQETFTIQISQD